MFSVNGKRGESFVLMGMFFQAVKLTCSLIQQLLTGYIYQGTSYGCEQKRHDPSFRGPVDSEVLELARASQLPIFIQCPNLTPIT